MIILCNTRIDEKFLGKAGYETDSKQKLTITNGYYKNIKLDIG